MNQYLASMLTLVVLLATTVAAQDTTSTVPLPEPPVALQRDCADWSACATGIQTRLCPTTQTRPCGLAAAELRRMFNDSVRLGNATMLRNLTGIPVALLHVTNPAARVRLERNVERFHTRHRFRYARLEASLNEQTGNRTLVRGTNTAHLLLWTVSLVDDYELDEQGTVVTVQRNFWSWLLPHERMGEGG